ncbi:uncharacterized protein LOC141904547 [Tubulanus polymorphus]|uniref:uncharacterized protein LOC141904547 n=1 Tax=Tubulanus polymorphus TaxID=672921 RepID=UPI003DA253B0
MIDQICQYSVIILLGNVAILLIVAVSTDYWEYRGFNRSHIENDLKASNRTRLKSPIDTTSYFSIHYLANDYAKPELINQYSGNDSDYQPPAFIQRYSLTETLQINNTTVERHKNMMDVIVLYEQYGNLFRDCDNLEAGVRRRLGIAAVRVNRCHQFIISGRPPDDYIARELPVVLYLERTAFALSVGSIVSIVVSVVCGTYGSISKYKRPVIIASVTALVSGVTLTLAIALFHIKCHLIRRREIMDGKELPFKRIINDSRTYSYGWSFVLAWICVALCFITSWTWLHKSQDMKVRYRPRRKHRGAYYAYTAGKDTDFL